MRKTELIVSGEVIHPKTKASIVGHEQTNIEALLDQQNRTSSIITQSTAMSKVGLGDNADLSFCTEDGFYESATFHGKTLVNCIQEPSRQDVVLPYEFEDGQYVTIKDTKDCGALGVELKGQTLVNLKGDISKSPQWVENDDAFCLDLPAGNGQPNICVKFASPLKRNAEYTVFVNIKSYTTGYPHICFMDETNRVLASDREWTPAKAGVLKTKFTTSSTVDAYLLRIIPRNGIDNTYTFSKEFIILEGDYTNQDIPYFEGIASVKMPSLSTVGKNLFDINKCKPSKTINDNGNEVTSSTPNHYAYGEFIPINNEFTISITSDNGSVPNNANGTRLRFYDENKNLVDSQWFAQSFKESNGRKYRTISMNGAKYLKINFNATGGNADTTYEAMQTIQIEEGSAQTSYEPHKSSILSLPEEVVLRSLPNGVHDTFNTRTGVYTQRIGEYTYNGSEEWKNVVSSGRKTTVWYVTDSVLSRINMLGSTKKPEQTMSISDKFPTYSRNDSYNISRDDEYVCSEIVCINDSRLTAVSVNGFKQWISQNPVTIQYQLATPIVTKINLPSTLKSWNTTTHLYSKIPENTLYPILSHSNPSYPVILKPSTKYSIVSSIYSNKHNTSAINFNLGGATASMTIDNRVATVTTPSTLTSEELVMSGRGNKLNNVMVIEGEIVGNEPYFEGICDCKSPALMNTGINLLDFKNATQIGGHYCTIINNKDGSITLTGTGDGSGEGIVTFSCYARMEEGRTYTFSFESDGVYSRVNGEDGVEAFLLKDGSASDFVIGMTGFSNTFVCGRTGDYHLRFDVNKNNTTHKFWNVQLIEGADACRYENYKANVVSCDEDKVELSENMFEQGSIYFSGGSTFASMTQNEEESRIRIKKLLSLTPGISYSASTSSGYYFTLSKYNNEQKGHSETGWTRNITFTPTSDIKDYGVVIRRSDNRAMAPSEFEQSNFQIRETGKAITLRSLPNGVCDTLNLETGEYVQRVGDCVLNGTESWVLDGYTTNANLSNENLCFYTRTIKNVVTSGAYWNSAGGCISNRLPSYGYDYLTGKSGNPEGISAVDGRIGISVNKTLLETYDEAGVKRWLTQNPIAVQYELATPIVTIVNIKGFPYAYKGGHILLSSSTNGYSLTPKLEYAVQTNRAGAIQSNQDRLINHDKRLAMLEDLVLHQLIQLEYNRAKYTFLSQTRQIFEGGIRMYHTKYELLSEFIEKKLYRSLEEVFEMLDVYFMLGDITDGEYDALYEALMPSAEEIFEVEEVFDHEDVEV